MIGDNQRCFLAPGMPQRRIRGRRDREVSVDNIQRVLCWLPKHSQRNTRAFDAEVGAIAIYDHAVVVLNLISTIHGGRKHLDFMTSPRHLERQVVSSPLCSAASILMRARCSLSHIREVRDIVAESHLLSTGNVKGTDRKHPGQCYDPSAT